MLLTPGTRVRCHDAEWLVTRIETTDFSGPQYAVFCTGADDLVRGKESVFLSALDKVEPVDPRDTRLTVDDSNGCRRSKLFLEAHLRQIPRTGVEPDFDGMGAFKPMEFQKNTVRKALGQLRPRLLLADAVGLGKTIQVGMVLVELLRRGRANRILVLTKKSMLTQFQSELWNRFAIPLVRLDSQGITRLRLRIPASKNPFEVYSRVIISIDTLKVLPGTNTSSRSRAGTSSLSTRPTTLPAPAFPSATSAAGWRACFPARLTAFCSPPQHPTTASARPSAVSFLCSIPPPFRIPA